MTDSAPAPPAEAGGHIELLEALRRVLIRSAIVAVGFAVGGYYIAEPVLVRLQRLTGVEMVAYGLPDAFFAMLKMALVMGLVAGMPYTFYGLLSILPKFFAGFRRRVLFGFWIASVLLFVGGILFCLTVTLPYGIKFLLGYQSQHVAALISVKRFVSFCLWMFLGFGLIFELPLAMMLLARIGLVNARQLGRYRRYAVLVIFIVAAVLTPTPDILNMTLMAAPLYLLFEIGLLGMRFWSP
ncbi:MAG: twin-arginine translocase subunit TatC [Desulfobacterales bacterium]|jgi:sec-independent protein translocase protein TatC|nr:twin-arginine translocase subunit TatC [Desulfobacteraceae bacterium]MDD3990977.1 twin-arginine translocase subunit TatC [Desulfobacteraceae bacterium]MDY0311898.1 twin-arginine translocase subunit TatC [Desulfobacterales bacterium]